MISAQIPVSILGFSFARHILAPPLAWRCHTGTQFLDTPQPYCPSALRYLSSHFHHTSFRSISFAFCESVISFLGFLVYDELH